MADVVVTQEDRLKAEEIVRNSAPNDSYGPLIRGLAEHRAQARKQALEEANRRLAAISEALELRDYEAARIMASRALQEPKV